FAGDPYTAQRRPRSVPSLPISRQGRCIGVLYLDNAAFAGAFNESRLLALDLLATQASISLENARLFDDTHQLNASLREENRERRGAEQALRDSEAALRMSEKQLFAYLEGLPVGIFVIGVDGIPSFMNRMASVIFETDLVAIRAHHIGQLFDAYVAGTEKRYPVAPIDPLASALAGERSMIDDIELDRSGERIPLAIWGSP